jgi:hypothetical protein
MVGRVGPDPLRYYSKLNLLVTVGRPVAEEQ